MPVHVCMDSVLVLNVRLGFEVQLAVIYMEVRMLETLMNCQRSGFLKVSLWSLIVWCRGR